jgi:subtilase family serine protease
VLPILPSALLMIFAFVSYCAFSRQQKPGRVSALCLALVVMVCGAWNAGQAQQSLQALHRHVRPAVSSGQAALVSPLPTTQRMNLSIVLQLRNQAELTSLLGRLYDPSSPDYHQFLSVEQFTEQFGPTAEDYQAVVDFAQSNGFTVTGTPKNRLLVPINGTVDQIQKAFHVRMNNYQHPTEKRTFFSPDREPSLNLSVTVQHIAGLNNYSIPHSMAMKATQGQSTPAVTGSGPGGTSYLSSDMRAAYYGGTALTGSGQCVGLLQFGGYDICHVTSSFGSDNGSYVPATSSSCVNGYSLDGTNYDLAYTPTAGGTTYTIPINNVLVDGGPPGSNGVDVEETLDIVQAIGMAPGLSQVRVYIGDGDVSIFNAMASETNPANLCKQLSVSWLWEPDDPGSPTTSATDDYIFAEFAAQGQNVFVASGDSGGYDAAISPVFYPAEDAYVTAVGGTSLLTNGAGGAWESPETAWNVQGNGSGGGPSPDGISIPIWQSEPEVANTSNGGSKTVRNVPDVAMEGDFDNYVCASTQSGYLCSGGWAGTSFAAPRWAGFMALVNQQAAAAGTAPKGGLGFINPAIYTIGEGSKYDNDFHDIGISGNGGNNDCCGQPASDTYTAVPGYDLVTGWGSPNGQSLIDALAGPLTTPVMTLAASPDNLTTYLGASGTSTIVINALGGFTGGVALTVSGLPSGVTPSGCVGLITTSCVLTLAVSNQAIPGNYLLTITGVSGSKNATTPLALTIDLPRAGCINGYGLKRETYG